MVMEVTMCDVSEGIIETGIYTNARERTLEAWAYNQRTGEAVKLGWIGQDVCQQFPKARRRWENSIWQGLLRSAGANLPCAPVYGPAGARLARGAADRGRGR